MAGPRGRLWQLRCHCRTVRLVRSVPPQRPAALGAASADQGRCGTLLQWRIRCRRDCAFRRIVRRPGFGHDLNSYAPDLDRPGGNPPTKVVAAEQPPQKLGDEFHSEVAER